MILKILLRRFGMPVQLAELSTYIFMQYSTIASPLNKMEQQGTVCPLLKDPSNYNPDTIDLINDLDEREYWVNCLKEMVRKFINKASALNPDYPDATEVAKRCFSQFSNHVEYLQTDPSALKSLTIRSLLEFNEKTLRDNNFKDAWRNQKVEETLAAEKQFRDRIDHVDSMESIEEKWLEVCKGVIGGNMFDWGAKAVTDILETSKNFTLAQAMDKIQKRPWFRDDLNRWIERLETKPYKRAVVFVDNAGFDFILGVLPFVRELLKLKTQVIISANSSPALNDITHKELLQCLQNASNKCTIIRESLDTEQLQAIENGQEGPCLDLGNLNRALCESLKDVDLIVLEGMGRAVHTNLTAQFNVDSLKMAVIKNEWLAQRLGTKQFSVIFEFVSAQ